jgi:nucleoside-diphosphate-sugar epimerase
VGKSVLLIGGSGFFGKSFLDARHRGVLGNQVERVTILSRSASRLAVTNPELMDSTVTLVDADMTKLEFLPEADITIDAAASTHVEDYQNDPDGERSRISMAAAHLSDLVRAARKPTKLLYVSSGAAYGSCYGLSGPIREVEGSYIFESGEGYKATYGEGKFLAEKHIRNLASDGLEVLIARAFSFVGRYLPTDQHYAIGDFIGAARSGGPVQLTSTRRVVRSYLHADDLARGLFIYALAADCSGQVVNLGSPTAIDLHEVAAMVAEKFNVSLEKPELSDAQGDWYVPDMTLARERLGFTPSIGLSQAIDELVS